MQKPNYLSALIAIFFAVNLIVSGLPIDDDKAESSKESGEDNSTSPNGTHKEL